MALFATFGGFATLVIANFGGGRKDKFVAHLGLAVAGSLALIIGTLVSGTTWLAALVTIPVTFAIFFAGVAGPNAVSGSTAAMFAYVLPVASAGGAGTIPSRLEGWWLASAAGTIAVLLLSPPHPRRPAPGGRGRTRRRTSQPRSGPPRTVRATQPQMMRAAKEKLRTAFTAAPFRPTGLATADQALSSLVQLLEWGTSQVGDAFDGHVDMTAGLPGRPRAARRRGGPARPIRARLLSGGEGGPGLRRARAGHATPPRHT